MLEVFFCVCPNQQKNTNTQLTKSKSVHLILCMLLHGWLFRSLRSLLPSADLIFSIRSRRCCFFFSTFLLWSFDSKHHKLLKLSLNICFIPFIRINHGGNVQNDSYSLTFISLVSCRRICFSRRMFAVCGLIDAWQHITAITDANIWWL